MATNRTNIVVGVFEQSGSARDAVDALRNAGFSYDQIGIATHEGGPPVQNLHDDLMALGVPEQYASYYNDEFKSGRTVVSVRPDGRDAEAMNILRSTGAYDYDSRNRSGGQYAQTTGYAQPMAGTQAGNYTQTDVNRDVVEDENARTLRLRAEQLQATKERVQAGEVNLRKEVVTEQQTINVPVTHEEVIIERHAVTGGQIDNTPIGQDEVIRIPVTEEQVEVTKTPVVTGEVVIGKRAVQEMQQVTDTVRHEEARIDNPENLNIQGNDVLQRNRTNLTDTDTTTNP